MSRRAFFTITPLLFAFALALACATPQTDSGEGLIEMANLPRDLHFGAIVIDTHSDTTPRFEDPDWNFLERHTAEDGHMDLPRIRDGGLDVEFWSIWMGKREVPGTALREALERIDAVHALVEANPDELVMAGSVEEIRAGVAAGKFVNVMGIEGGHIIEESLPALRNFYRLGVRYMTLTHSFNTTWADSSGTTEVLEPLHNGLTDFGREVVREMNRIGMMVDISHVSDKTFVDVLEVARAPVIASHSSARSVADHPRNMTDDMLRALRDNGGVVMINFYPVYIDDAARDAASLYFERHAGAFKKMKDEHADDPRALRTAKRAYLLANPAPRSPLDSLLDHFDHAMAIAGPDHVGIGADWDGVPSMPVGMEDVTKLPDLTRALLDRGHAPETIRLILGENLLRVMGEVERVSAAWGTTSE
jgi:membrane dipeptidase